MQQERIVLNTHIGHFLSDLTWNDCQRKSYYVYAILPPAGFFFANKLYQPYSYNYLMQKHGNIIVHKSLLDSTDLEFLKQYGYYETDGKQIVICGTRGELELIAAGTFIQQYLQADGLSITKVPTAWTQFSHPTDFSAHATGAVVPIKYLAVYQGEGPEIHMNDPAALGHYKGDLLLLDKKTQMLSIINNEVFAATYNQTVGGWSQNKLITPQSNIKSITLKDVKQLVFNIPGTKRAPSDLNDINKMSDAEFIRQADKQFSGDEYITVPLSKDAADLISALKSYAYHYGTYVYKDISNRVFLGTVNRINRPLNYLQTKKSKYWRTEEEVRKRLSELVDIAVKEDMKRSGVGNLGDWRTVKAEVYIAGFEMRLEKVRKAYNALLNITLN